MEEEFIYPSDEELAASFVDDLFSAFMVEIKRYPVLSIEEQKDLARKYRKGDMSAREKLINHNLRLVVYIASAYKDKIKHLKIMDIIQEGVIGLMRAIDKYDPDIGAFSTYAIPWIRQAVTRSIDDNEDEIRKPVHITYKIRKYRHILAVAERNNTPIPNDQELMEMLDCNEDALDLIKEKSTETVVSAQTKVGDEDDSELGDFIADTKNDFNDVLDNIDDQELLVVIKNKLRPIEYYFLYYYEIDKKSEDATLQLLADEFNITRERVRQLKKKAYDKSGKYVKDKKIRHMEGQKIENNLGIPLSKIDIKPYNINNIVLYLIIKKKLSEVENKVLRYILFSELKLDAKEVARCFNISIGEYAAIVKKIDLMTKECLEDRENFENEKNKTVNMYGTKIFELIPIDELKLILEREKMHEEQMHEIRIKEREEELKRREEKERQERERRQEEEKRFNKIRRFEEKERKNKEKFESYAKEAKDRLHSNEEDEKRDILDLIDINDHNTLVVLKMKLTHEEYYIFYQLLMNKNKVDKTIKDMAKSLNLSTISIWAYKNRIAKKIERFFNKEDFINEEVKRLTDKYNMSIDNFSSKPVDPEKIILMAYVHDNLSDIENRILNHSIFGATEVISDEELNTLNIPKEEYQEISEQLKKKIDNLLLDLNKFKIFKKHILRTYGIKIFNKDFDRTFNDIDYEALKRTFEGKTIEEIKDLYGEDWDKLDANSQYLLRRYFSVPNNSFVSNSQWEEAFYLELDNISLSEKEIHLSPKVLYDCYLENKDCFSENAQIFLEGFVFETRDKSEYTGKKDRQSIATHRSLLLDKLEKIYFNVHNILYSFDFTKEQWEKVLEKHEDKFDENRIIAMNMFYGVDGEAMSIPEIAEVFGVDKVKMHDYLAKIRKTAMALYMNRSNLRDVDEDIYIPYVLNRAIPFTDLNREILLMYLIQKLSYAEIKDKLKKKGVELSQYQLSNIVTEGLRKVDFYRFGLIGTNSYSTILVERFLEENKDKYSAKEKEIIRAKYLEHLDNDFIALKLNMKKNEVNKQVQRFNTLLDNYKAMDAVLTEEDYLKEFNTYPLERVVDEKQMHMLSYYYGIKCYYNPEGLALSAPQMTKQLPEYADENPQALSRKIKKANDLIKRKKKKQFHNDLVFMPTDEVSKIIDDPHLPISEKEKYIICSIYGIKRFKQKTLKELSQMYGEGEGSIRRRYQRAFVSIFKYKKGEIPAKIDYDYDILPLMRYFSKYDRMLIEDSYKKGLSYEKIAKKYKLTINQVITRFNRLNLAIFEMINNPKNSYFDFEIYEKAIKDPLFPFYGNLEEAVKIFDLHFANTQVKNMSGKEIVTELGLNRDEKSVNKTLYNLILAVCRYKSGVRKEHTYTFEDVKDYYMRHKDEMAPWQEKLYLTYFKRHLKEDANRNKELINKLILKDIIKERNQGFKDISVLSHDEMIELIRNRNFSPKVLNTLLNMIGETEKVIMTGQELNHVYRLLSRLDKTVRLDDKHRLMKA